MASYTIEENDSNRRLDRILRQFLKNVPISFIYSSIRKGRVRLNGKKIKGKEKTSLGDVLYIDDKILSCNNLELDRKKQFFQNYSYVKKLSCLSAVSKNKKLKIDILFKNKDLLFINKPQGVATHGKGSVDEEVKRCFVYKNALAFSVGALHRLDKDTTGVLAFSQSLKGAQLFSKAIQENKIERYYMGINEGRVETKQWKIKSTNNVTEVTDVFVLEYSKKADLSLCLYRLITGKKHQIRKGSSNFTTPLFCDAKYGSKRREHPTYFLHSLILNFSNPLFPDIPEMIVAPLPDKFLKMIRTYFPNTFTKISDHLYENIIKKIVSTSSIS